MGSPGAIVDGRPAHGGPIARLRRCGQRLMVSRAEQAEAVVERRLLAHPGVTRANTVAVMSPAGGVGKTTCTFLVGNLLATHLKLRAIAIDASPELGTLAQLVPEKRRVERDLTELLDDADRLHTAADLTPYVSRLPTGLHVLAHDRRRATCLRPTDCGELVALLSCFYEVVLLDLGPGVVGPLATLAARRADQVVLVATPATVGVVLDALDHLPRQDRVAVAINDSDVTLPHDRQLAVMLESGTYSLGALRTPTRLAIKRLGLTVADRLV